MSCTYGEGGREAADRQAGLRGEYATKFASARPGFALGLVLLLTFGAVALPLPGAEGKVVEVTLYGRDVPSPGWSLTPGNQTDPGPTFRVNLGDEIRLRLIAEDGLPHVFYIDYDANGRPTLGLEPISAEFSAETMLNFTADQAGSFTYWCAVHQPDMSGGWVTNAPPAVTISSPPPGASWTGGTDHEVVLELTDDDVPQNTTLWVNFTYAAGTQADSIAGPSMGSPNLVVPWNVPLIDATDATLRVDAVDRVGLRSTTLSAPFEIDSTPPAVAGRLPSPGAQDVPRNVQVEVTWSEGMNETSAGSGASFGLLWVDTGTWVSGSVNWGPDSRTSTFVPADPLASEATYAVHVNASAKDDSQPGNAVMEAASWTFLTSGVVDLEGPSISGLTASPSVAQPGEIVSIDATITDPSGVTEAWVLVEGPDTTLNLTLVRFGDRWFLNRSWEASGIYQIEVGAQDGAGNVNTARESFQIQGPLGSVLGLVVLLGTLAALGAGGIVYLWIRRKPEKEG